MKIRIVHVLYSLGLGGLEGVVAGLVRGMDTEIFSHSICILENDLASLEKFNLSGVDVHIVKRHFRHDPTVVLRLVRVFGKLKPDIVATYNWAGMEGIVAARLCGIKNIVHSEHGLGTEEALKKKRGRLLERRILLKCCVKVIAVSRAIQAWLIDKVKADGGKVICIPNGCDTSEFHPGKDLELRKRLGINDSDAVMGTVGSLIELKGHKELLEAFSRIARSRSGVRLMFVGDGPLRKDLEELSGKLGIKEKVIFAGRVMDVSPFYRAMDSYALSSFSEALPMALLEAMATALPIIATDVGDVKYMLGGGKGGIIVKPKDVDALESGMRYFLDHPDAARENGNFARKRAEVSFNIVKTKDAYEKLYKSLTENR